jgi:predicted RNase H-like nuclease (RuvC/YqgF family)
MKSGSAFRRGRLSRNVPGVGETMGERDGLIARIQQIRRTAESSATTQPTVASGQEATELQALQTRVEHLERLVEALQDSIHRESDRQGKEISELEARLQPAALSVALNKDARDRGL